MAVHEFGGNLGLMVTESLTAAQAAATFDDLRGCGMVSAQLAGTFTATITFEVSNDGTTWSSLPMGTPGGAALSSTATATGLFIGPVCGYHKFRARCSSFVSGPIVVTLRAAHGAFSGLSTTAGNIVVGPAADGAAASGNPVLVAGADGSGNVQTLLTTTAGLLQIAAGTSTPFSTDAIATPVGILDSGGTHRPVATNLHISNGTTWDRLRAIAAVDNTSATGVLASGMMLQQSASIYNAVACISALGDGGTGQRVVPAGGMLFNGTNYDRARSANGGNNTTGTGLLGAAQMCYDGTNYQRSLCDTTGTQKTGKFTASIKTALTVQAAAYSANDLVGGKHTYTSATRITAGGAVIKSILIGDKAANSAANSVYDLYLFDSDPASTTFSENTALTVADADLNKIIAVVRFDGVAGSTLFTNVDNNVIYRPVDIPIQLSGAITTLTGALIARGGPTYAATTDVFITLLVEYT